MPAADPPGDVDALRAKLKALGYLDAGVDRFVLGSVRQRDGRLRNALRASLRIGILTGALLGPAAAVGLAVRAPELVTGARDALVVAGYLVLLFGGAAASAAFCASALVAMVLVRVRRREGLAALARRSTELAGGLVAGLCLLYLTLWWRGVVAKAELASTWTAVVLLIAVAISFVLGRAVTATASAILAHADPVAFDAPRGGRRRTAPALLALLAFSGAAALLLASSIRATTEPPPARLVVVPTGVRLLVIGIDGFDAALAERLAGEGRLPTLARWMAGARATAPKDPANDPVRAWTTLATGLPPSAHGVAGLEVRAVAGLEGRVSSASEIARALAAVTDLLRLTRPTLSSSSERQALAFWEVAARAGLKTGAVNWWTTFPTQDADGLVVSERGLLRLQRDGPGSLEIGPATLDERLVGAWPGMRDAVAQEVRRVSRSVPTALGEAVARSAEIDLSVAAIAASVAPDASDLLVVYFPGLDILQSAVLGGGSHTPAALAERLDAIGAYYAMLDATLESMSRGGATNVVLVGYPGRTGDRADAFFSAAPVAPADAGGALPTTGRSRAPRLEDLAPTVLAALGVPLSREFAGAPLFEWPSTGPATEARLVPTYGRRAPPDAESHHASPLDDEMRERLRSLGYVR